MSSCVPGPRWPLRLFPALPLLVCAACEGGEASRGEAGLPDSRPLVVASIFPVGDLAAFLAGDAARVEVLLPPGASDETFEPTARQVARLSRARAYLFIGAGMDRWAETLTPSAGGAVTARLTEGLLLLLQGQEHEGAGETGNPHVWLDPILVRDQLLPRIEAVLLEVAPHAAPGLRERRKALEDSLTALHEHITSTLAGVPSRGFLATHSAWSYFAERYGLEELGAVYESPGREPSTRGVARLVASARRAGVGAVFVEPQLGEAGARALATELGVRVRLLDPLGGPGLEGRESYLSLMRFNAREMALALRGGP